jgi:hypothetical protein
MKKISIFRSLWLKTLVLSLVAFSLVFTGVALAARDAGPWSPEYDIGTRHIDMAEMFDLSLCLGCHSNEPPNYMMGPLTPPALDELKNVDMGGNRACSACHGNNIFTAFMEDDNSGGLRCSDCHDVGSSGGGRGGWGGRSGGGRGGWGR